MAAPPPEGKPMPNPFSPPWSLHVPHAALLADAPMLAHDEDLALGCECANPALQLEGWEPAPATQSVSPGSC
jgi:hypothetical protein